MNSIRDQSAPLLAISILYFLIILVILLLYLKDEITDLLPQNQLSGKNLSPQHGSAAAAGAPASPAGAPMTAGTTSGREEGYGDSVGRNPSRYREGKRTPGHSISQHPSPSGGLQDQPAQHPPQKVLSYSRLLFHRGRLLISLGALFYIFWYTLTYYSAMPLDFCRFSPRIEIFSFTSIRSAVMIFFLYRLKFVSTADPNFPKVFLGISIAVGLAWIFGMFQAFNMDPGLNFDDKFCDYELGDIGFTGYSLSIATFALIHFLLFHKFMKVLVEHQRIHGRNANAQEAELARIKSVIFRTKVGFYGYTIATLIADVTYVLVYYIFYDAATATTEKKAVFIGMVDFFYTTDAVVSVLSVMATYYRFWTMFSFRYLKFKKSPEDDPSSAEPSVRQKEVQAPAIPREVTGESMTSDHSRQGPVIPEAAVRLERQV